MPHIYCWKATINIFPMMLHIDPCLSAANSNIENSEKHLKTIPFKEHLITFYLVKLMSHVVCHWKALINGFVCAADTLQHRLYTYSDRSREPENWSGEDRAEWMPMTESVGGIPLPNQIQVVLRLTAYFAQQRVLCVTRTRVLKAVDEDEEVGNNRQ